MTLDAVVGKAERAYPDWLAKTLIGFVRRTVCMNEWELMDVKAIDLHRQADLPQRLDVLFESLQEGFGKHVLVTGSFLAFGYDSEAGTWVFPRFVEFGKDAPAMRELREDDGDVAVRAFDHAREGIPSAAARPLIVHVPYFARKAEWYGADGEISIADFRRKFADQAVIFTDVIRVTSESDVRRWLAPHRLSHYEQRFLFTLGFNVANGIGDTFADPKLKEALGLFLGMFLSRAGMRAAESTRYMMAAAVARLAHYSHEFLKPFVELRQFLSTHSASIPPELRERLRPVLNSVTLLELSSIGTALNAEKYGFTILLKRSLMHNTTVPEAHDLRDGRVDCSLTIGDVVGRKVSLVCRGLPDESVSIRFAPPLFDRLIRNLLRNAAQHGTEGDRPIQIEIVVSEDREYGRLNMRFTHLGSNMKRRVARLLFRMPIQSADPSGENAGNRGLGLWAVGLAFEAQRLPLPVVRQDPEGLSFLFFFPMK